MFSLLSSLLATFLPEDKLVKPIILQVGTGLIETTCRDGGNAGFGSDDLYPHPETQLSLLAALIQGRHLGQRMQGKGWQRRCHRQVTLLPPQHTSHAKPDGWHFLPLFIYCCWFFPQPESPMWPQLQYTWMCLHFYNRGINSFPTEVEVNTYIMLSAKL